MKNKKVKIETKYEKLTKEEISSHKSFSNVHQNYLNVKPHNFLKSPKKLTVASKTIIAVTAVAVASFGTWKYFSNHNGSQQSQVVTQTTDTVQKPVVNYTRTPKSAPYVHPPIKNVNVPYKTYSVDANKASTITYNKSKIKIPAKAFCDQNGKEVTGKVDIKYREFHNAVDFFVSGIPMTYDSAGKQYIFESAGMMDIQGYQNGIPVNIKPDKTIGIEMASTDRSDIHYNVYELDTANRNWIYMAKSNNVVTSKNDSVSKPVADQQTTQEMQEAQSALASAKKDEQDMQKKKPMQPTVYKDYSRVFNIDADKKEFPELAVYKNVLFEVDKNDKSFNPAYTKYSWEDASLTKNAEENSYTFTVKRAKESHSFVVHPVFDQKDYQAAMQEYDKKFHDYQVALNTKVEEEKKEEQAFADAQKRQKEEEERWQQAMAAQISAEQTSQNIVSYFGVKRFGIFNCDHPGVAPTGASLAAKYTDKSGNLLNSPCVYLAEKGRNALFTYYPGAHFDFNPKVTNLAWCVTDSNMIAIYSPAEFKEITQTRGQFTFAMALATRRIESMADIKKFFADYM